MPLDINDFREDRGGNVEKLRELQRRRFQPVELVDEIVRLDKEWRETRTAINSLNQEKNAISKVVGKKKRAKEDASEEQAKAIELGKKIKEMTVHQEELAVTRDKKVKLVGNYVHDSVPVSNDEDADNAVVSTWGTPVTPTEFHPHHHLLWMIGGYEPARGSNVAGHRGYFLTGPGMLLNQALIQFATTFLVRRDYKPVQPPYFMNKDAMAKVAQLADFDEALYHVTGEGGDQEKYLIATSEQPLCGYHEGDWINPKETPLRYAGVSTCFRKEAGNSGRDMWGIFRVHQFDKVEQFCITSPDKSWEMHEEMREAAEEFTRQLGLPYRVVNIVSGELNNAAAKKYDLEAWFPGYGAYRELVSCSNCTDYQARAMEIRYGFKKGGTKSDREARKEYVHMLNSTLCATSRAICCILETYQTESGVKVPEVLVPFMGGMTFMPFVRPPPEVDEPKSKGKGKGKDKKAAAAGAASGDAPVAPAAQ